MTVNRAVFGLAVLISALGGCKADSEWTTARAACGLPGADDASLLMSRGARELPFDTACARAIAADLRVDWSTVDEERFGAALREDELTSIVAGLWVTLGAGLGTFGAMVDDPAIPERFADELRTVAAARALGDEAPAGQVLYDWTVGGPERTVVDPSRSTAGFDHLSRTLILPTEHTQSTAWASLGTVVHEASHSGWRRHVDCDHPAQHGSFDNSWEGAYGVEGFVLHLLSLHAGRDAPVIASAVEANLNFFCAGTDLPTEAL